MDSSNKKLLCCRLNDLLLSFPRRRINQDSTIHSVNLTYYNYRNVCIEQSLNEFLTSHNQYNIKSKQVNRKSFYLLLISLTIKLDGKESLTYQVPIHKKKEKKKKKRKKENKALQTYTYIYCYKRNFKSLMNIITF